MFLLNSKEYTLLHQFDFIINLRNKIKINIDITVVTSLKTIADLK